MTHRIAVTALLGTLLLAGCAPDLSRTNEAPPAIPAPMADVPPKPPLSGETLVWQPGYWDWIGSGFAWHPGQYVPAAGHGNLWMPGYWERGPSGWVWQPPHWTS